MSLNSSFLLSPFFFLSFFFNLRKCLSRRTEACNKSYSLIYYWCNRILSVSLFLFWIRIVSIFWKGRRKNSLSCSYLWRGLNVHIPFFLRASDTPRIGWISAFLLTSVQRFCSNLFSGDFPRSLLNWRLSLANVCPELNFLFQIFSYEKDGIWH